MRPGAAFFLAALGLAACSNPPEAPGKTGECLLVDEAGKQTLLEAGVPNVETCAARLEAEFLKSGRPLRGAYAGHWILVDAQRIWMELNGRKVPLIHESQRKSIDTLIQDGARPVVGQR